jgi:hypothetical protein
MFQNSKIPSSKIQCSVVLFACWALEVHSPQSTVMQSGGINLWALVHSKFQIPNSKSEMPNANPEIR